MAAESVDYLLIGGGLACATAAETLREVAPESSVMLVGREPDPPYHRPPCSKGYLRGCEQRSEAFVHPQEWYERNHVRLLTRTSVTGVDPERRIATLSDRREVVFGKALLATGANVRRLRVDGSGLDGIHYLRTLGNADAIRAELDQVERVVLIGGSYIGCEVAASLTAAGKSCAIVMQEQLPLQRSFGENAGRFFAGVLESHGVEIHGGDELAGFDGDGRVSRVITAAGLELPAELVVIGAGASPEVRLAAGAGLPIGERGGVCCAPTLQTPVPGVFAAGDICEYDSPLHGGPMRLEHWDVAASQGRTAALNMAGDELAHDAVPYFFSDLADWVSLEYVGPAFDWDREVLRGSFDDGSFTNWYLKGGRLLAALSVGRSEDIDHARRLLAGGGVLDEVQHAVLGDGELASVETA